MKYKKLEEIFNFVTHYIGAGMAIVGCIVLIIHAVQNGNTGYIIGSAIFGSALILMYSMSGTYHIVENEKVKRIFKILDHSFIYVLISASYTPYLLTVLHGKDRWVLFGIQWGLTLIGILFNVFFVGKYRVLSTLIYVIMGWIIVVVYKDLKLTLSIMSLRYLLISGVIYTIGTIFYVMKNVKFSHPIWHLFVLGGSILGYLSIYNIYAFN